MIKTYQPVNTRWWTVKGLEEAIAAAGKSYEQVADETGIAVHTLQRLATGKQRAQTATIATLRRALGQTSSAGTSTLRKGW